MKSSVKLVASTLFSLMLFANPVLAKQCIWNKAGFILDVAWVYDTVVYGTDQILLGQGTCIEGDGYDVILSIVGGDVADSIAAGAITGALTALGAVFGGPTNAAIAAGAASMLNDYIPEPQNIFYTGPTSSQYYLDVWGTIWDPQVGDGGPI